MPPIEMLGRNSHLSHSMLFIYFYNLEYLFMSQFLNN